MANILKVSEYLEGAINKRRLSHYESRDEFIGYLTQEIEHWKQRCEELEIELLMLENSYDVEPVKEMDIKYRGIF